MDNLAHPDHLTVVEPEHVRQVASTIHYIDICCVNPLLKRRQVLETLLRQWRKDPTNKVLIFTKSVKLIGILEFLLKKSSKCLHNMSIMFSS
jgi:hypothetical protein